MSRTRDCRQILRWLAMAALASVLGAAPVTRAEAGAGRLVVFAASSMTDVLEGLAAQHAADGAARPTFSFASSAALARQIEAGAPAEVFISADREWMDYLATRGLLHRGSRRDIAGNRLVLVAPAASSIELAIEPGFDILGALGPSRLAIGDPASVPAGRYARGALESLGVWSAVAGRLAPAENVRAALAWVARGEAPLGIVYASDALGEPAVRTVATFPPQSHPPIRYVAAAMPRAGAAALGFLDFLCTPAARTVFERYGFLALGHDGSGCGPVGKDR